METNICILVIIIVVLIIVTIIIVVLSLTKKVQTREHLTSRTTCTQCPDGWTLKDYQNRICTAPDSYDGPCDKTSHFQGYSVDKSKKWAENCKADWTNPCGTTCTQCPPGWTLTDDSIRECTAPDSYDGPCDKVSKFPRYTADEVKQWANECDVHWPDPCGSGCCYCIVTGGIADTIGKVAYNDSFDECLGWCYECRDNMYKGAISMPYAHAIFDTSGDPCHESTPMGWERCSGGPQPGYLSADATDLVGHIALGAAEMIL